MQHVVSSLGVEVPGGLVGQQQQRVVGQRAGNRHPLLLAAGELVGHPLAERAQANLVQQVLCPLACTCPPLACVEQRQGHVVEHVHAF